MKILYIPLPKFVRSAFNKSNEAVKQEKTVSTVEEKPYTTNRSAEENLSVDDPSELEENR